MSATTDLCPGAANAAELEITIWVEPGSQLLITSGTRMTLFQEEDGRRTQTGVYWALKPTKKTRNTYKVYAYDAVCKLDSPQSQWLDSIQNQFPMSLWSFAQNVAAQCGLSIANSGLPRNGDFLILPFSAEDLTARQMLSWVAEASCTFLRANAMGQLCFDWWEGSSSADQTYIGPGTGQTRTALRLAGDTLRTEQQEVWSYETQHLPYWEGTLSYEEYETAPIDKVQIRQSSSDVGVLYPGDETGTNALVIQGNLLLTSDTDDRLRPVAQAIYEEMCKIHYTPATVSLQSSAAVPAPGSIVHILDAHHRELTVYIMERTIRGQKVTLTSTGNARRDDTVAVNEQNYRSISGKMLEIRSELDGLDIRASELAGNYSELKQSVDSISLEVTQASEQNLFGIASWVPDGRSPANSYTVAGTEASIQTSATFSDLAGVSIALPDEELSKMAGNTYTISVDFRVLQSVQTPGKDSVIVLWVNYPSGNVSYRLKTLYTNATGTGLPVQDWSTCTLDISLKDETPTRVYLFTYLYPGTGHVELRNPALHSKYYKKSEIHLTRDGVMLSSALLDLSDYASQKDYTQLKMDQEELSLTVVKDGNVRSKFAADSTSVTIESGVITFASNTLVVDSDNFQLDRQGNVQITGSFHSNASNGNQVNLSDGIASLYARDSSGTSYPTTIITRTASSNPCGILDVYGRSSNGDVNPQVRLQGGVTDGSIHLYNAFGTEQAVLTSGESNISWLAGGLDVRGTHGVQAYYGSIGKLAITELGVNDGVIQKVYWKWDGNLGAYVLSTSP